jgi:hypothetical protein
VATVCITPELRGAVGDQRSSYLLGSADELLLQGLGLEVGEEDVEKLMPWIFLEGLAILAPDFGGQLELRLERSVRSMPIQCLLLGFIWFCLDRPRRPSRVAALA